MPAEHDQIIKEGYNFGFDGLLEWYNKHYSKGRINPSLLTKSISFLMDQGIVRRIANDGEYGAKPKIMHVFLRGNLLKSADIKGTDQEKVERIRRAKRAGKDGVVFKNIADGGEVSTHYAIFDNRNIKSADPVTYDDKGNVIPLSERFNSENADIRYSFEEDVEALDEEYRQVMDSETVPHRTAGDLKWEIGDTIERGSRQEQATEPTATVTRTVPAGEFYPEGTTVTHTYGRGKPFYSKTTNLSPKEALSYLQAATGVKWRIEPMRKGLWKAVMTGEKLDTVYAPAGYNKAVKELRAADKNAQVPTVKEFAEQKLAEGWRDQNAPSAATVHAEGIKKSDFTASKALNKIGVKIDGSVTDYSITQNMRSAEEARRRIVREIYKAEKYWDATKAEKQVAVDIANGDLSYFDIPDSCRFDVVSELAALRMDERMAGNNLVQQRRYAIRDSLLGESETTIH